MKKKPFFVTPIMRKRINAEMTLHNQTQQDVADRLFYSKGHIGDVIRGKRPLGDDLLEKMLSLWDVREEYLRGIDPYRREEDMLSEKRNAEWNALGATINYLNSLCIKKKKAHFVRFKINDIISGLNNGLNVDELFSIVDPDIKEPLDNWKRFKHETYAHIQAYKKSTRLTGELKYSCNQYCYFEICGTLTSTILDAAFEGAADDYTETQKTVLKAICRNYYRITINGEFIGYAREDYTYEIMETINETSKSLVRSMIKAHQKNAFYSVENGAGRLDATELEPLPFL